MRILENRKPKSIFQIIRGWLFFILILLVLIFAGMNIMKEQLVMPDKSMYPALSENDTFIEDRVTYRFKDPSRFDVVVFSSRYQSEGIYVKRIIALPGETVQILDGQVYVNGRLLQEDLDLGLESIEQAGTASSPVTLGEDEYFVLGDNRNDSTDSRDPSVGTIRREEITGKAWLITWPLKHMGLIG